MKSVTSWFLLLLFLLGNVGTAQQARYQLGKQVIGFESAFQENMDRRDMRRAVLPNLEQAVQSFFRLSFDSAEKSIDKAWITLLPSEHRSVAAALIPIRLTIDKHWFDSTENELPIELTLAYDGADIKYPLTMTVKWRDTNGREVVAQVKEISQFPVTSTIAMMDLAEGDWSLDISIKQGDFEWRLPAQMVSRTKDVEARYAKLKSSIDGRKSKDPDTVQRSSQLMLTLLRDLKSGRALETDIPANRILGTLEQWNEALESKTQVIKLERPGEYWLELDGKSRSSVVRVSVPQNIAKGGTLPVLFAFHGAGGSENMFFDAYGAGAIVGLSEKAGYLLVCPRQPLLGGVIALDEMLDGLESLLPIDREHVAVMGHSMGAAQTIAQVERSKPGIVQGAVILGGGRSITKPEVWRTLPVFAGAGERDFGRRGVELFAASCRKEGGEVREEIYDSIEHLGIVQVSLPDVFRWLEPRLKK